MSVYIKNTTASIINLVGQDIDPYLTTEDYFLVLAENETRWGNDSEVLKSISNGSIIISKRDDGLSDILDVSESINYIKNIFPSELKILGSNGLSPSVTNGKLDVNSQINIIPPELNNQYQVIISSIKVDLPKESESFASIYSYSGTGLIHSFVARFNSDEVICELVIDGVTIVSIDCDDLEDISVSDNSMNFGSLSWEKSRNVLMFKPKSSMRFNSTIEIKAKANSSSKNKDLTKYIIDITKEI